MGILADLVSYICIYIADIGCIIFRDLRHVETHVCHHHRGGLALETIVGRTAHTISIVLTSFYNANTDLLPFFLVVCNLHMR